MRTKTLSLVLTACVLSLCVFAFGNNAHAVAFRSPSLGGATGLIMTPTARTGWEGANLGLDLGMGYTGLGDDSWLPKATLQLFDRWELGAMYELLGEDGDNDQEQNDLYLHTKFRIFPWSGSSNSALAIGVNYQSLKYNDESYTAYQFYLAATYSGDFFGMPAETTIVFGKTLGDDEVVADDNWDFSMGFDLDLFPKVFQHYVHWINDFSNYTYTVDPLRNVSGYRGCFNTGIRIAAFKGHRKYKLNFDVLVLDVLDDPDYSPGRELAAAVTFGLAI